jgi:hypothetical protein
MLSRPLTVAALAAVFAFPAAAQQVQYKVLATLRTSTMEKELNEMADQGYRFQSVMGGETALGGNEVVAVMSKAADAKPRFAYKLLATTKTSTMQKELQDAADLGYEYKGQTVFKSAFGGNEVVCILERDKNLPAGRRFEYKLLATTKTGTLDKELNEIGIGGYSILGMTVAKTALGGKELVAITSKPVGR